MEETVGGPTVWLSIVCMVVSLLLSSANSATETFTLLKVAFGQFRPSLLSLELCFVPSDFVG